MPFDTTSFDTASFDPTLFSRLEALMHRDPARRGLATYCVETQALDAGQLQAAATSLARAPGTVAIVTGFCILSAEPPSAETDGPPGALMLAATLVRLGYRVILISDAYGVPLLEVGAAHLGLRNIEIETCPGVAPSAEKPSAVKWIDDFLESPAGKALTHLISIERVGPSHTFESVTHKSDASETLRENFQQLLPPSEQDVCHNMRGRSIDHLTAPLHLLFDRVREQRLPVTTIGIGDGGNELGMGSLAWEVLCAAIASPVGPRIACRVPVDHLLIAGVSDWGGYALALATAALADRFDVVSDLDSQRMGDLIRQLVEQAGAVDGVTAQRVASVDGLPLETYLQILAGMREGLGLPA